MDFPRKVDSADAIVQEMGSVSQDFGRGNSLDSEIFSARAGGRAACERGL
jgi:tetrahydromethanopterin S-methyltransferase subunit F